MNNYKYWMVHDLSVESSIVSPVAKFDDATSAFREAERLAESNPGKTFNVLEATYSFRTEKPQVVRRSIEAAPVCGDRFPELDRKLQ